MSAGNCSDVPPYSNDYIHDVTLTEQILIGIVSVLCLCIFILFIDKAWFIYSYYGNHGDPESIRNKSLLLIGIYPVVGITSLLAVYIPRSKLLSDFVASVYIAICLYQFTVLIVLYFGGKAKLVEKANDTGFRLRNPPCCCMCCCCPTVEATASNLNRLQMLVLQTSFIQPVIAFVSMVLWLDDKYNPDVTTFSSSSTYLSSLYGISTLVAMYGLIVIFRATRYHLRSHSITPKFLVLQMVLIVEGLQKFVLRFIASQFNLPPCRGVVGSSVRADAIHHMLAIAEMFLLSFVARIVYRRPTMQEMAAEGYRKISGQFDPEYLQGSKVPQEKIVQDDEDNATGLLLRQGSVISYRSLSMDSTRPEVGSRGCRTMSVEDTDGCEGFHMVDSNGETV